MISSNVDRNNAPAIYLNVCVCKTLQLLMFVPHMNQNTDDTIFKSVLATEMQIKGVKYDNYTILLSQ